MNINSEISNNHIILPFMDNQDVSNTVKCLVNNNINIYRVTEKTKNLEEIYLSMVKENGL